MAERLLTNWRGLAAGLLAALAAALVQVGPAEAATRTVTSAADSGTGSLRDTIAGAAAGDIVQIANGVNPALTSGEIVVSRNLTIRGQGAMATTIGAGSSSRIFRITGATVTVEDLTLTAGRAPSGAGGGSGGGPGGAGEDGGAILNQQGANLILRRVTITGSRAGNGGAGGSSVLGLTGGNGGNGGRGGAVASFGTLTIQSSTITGNRAGNGGAPGSGILGDGAPGAGGSGGGVYVNGGAGRRTTLENVTMNDNAAGNGARGGFAGGGGAIFADGGGVAGAITINHATLVGNSAGSGSGAAGGGLGSRIGITVSNSILAGNTATAGGPNCSGASIADAGHNVARPRGGCPASFASGDPKLDPKGLADNGGPTKTIAIVERGSAMNQVAPSENCAATDQRGISRPQGTRCDIGAFEARAPSCEDVTARTRPGRTISVRLRCSGGGTFRYATASTPEHGKLSDLSPNDGTVKYTAGRVFRGEDSFTYKGTNFVGDSPAATVTITIGGPPPPPNNFRFGKVDLNRREGTADLPVKVPGPGKLRISGKGVKEASKSARRKGSVVLPVRPSRSARRRLKRQGVATVTAVVTYTPKGGFPQKRTKEVRLRVNKFSVPI